MSCESCQYSNGRYWVLRSRGQSVVEQRDYNPFFDVRPCFYVMGDEAWPTGLPLIERYTRLL
jgi:hypothetical protein